MPSRWLLVFSVAAAVADRLPPVLADIPRVAVATAPEDDQVVVTVEVDADPDVVDVVTRQVREADPDATRLHDSIIDTPTVADDRPASASMDFDVADDPAPCEHCANWRYEITTGEGERPVLREWHRVDCPEYQSWL